MSNIRFVVFHVGVEVLHHYLPLMRAGKEALAVTNPGARYVVLTDKETAPHLKKEFEVEVLAPGGLPLMAAYITAQAEYEKRAEPGLVILAATDCVANRDLSDSLKHNIAVTYRFRKNDCQRLVNNVAYIEDHDRGAWFLERCLGELWNINKQSYTEWWGDQEAWQRALGPVDTWEKVDDQGVRLAKPDGVWIHLYPCSTHNYFNKFSGASSCQSEIAYILHFKGSRKKYMVDAVTMHILGGRRIPGIQDAPRTNWKLNKLDGKRTPSTPE